MQPTQKLTVSEQGTPCVRTQVLGTSIATPLTRVQIGHLHVRTGCVLNQK
jgi:hypothetical protein